MSKLIFRIDSFVSKIRRWLRPRIKIGGKLDRVLKRPSLMLSQLVPAYRQLKGDGVFFRESELHACASFPKRLLDATLECFQPKTILDLGCGTGVSLDYFLEHDVEVVGIEGSPLAIARARNPQRIIEHNLNAPLGLHRRFDLVWSYEVVEHIHPRYVDVLLRTFSDHGDVIVMSAARPGQGGEGHFNEQEPDYWEMQFAKFGFTLNLQLTERLRGTGEMWSGNILVFLRNRLS